MIYTGLDISTTTVGYSSIDENESLLNYGYIDLSKEKGLYEKVALFEQSLSAMPFPDFIAAEDIMNRFMQGKSNIKVIIKLAQFNALACDRCITKFSIQPTMINVNTARRTVIGKIPKGINSKQFVLEWIVDKYKDIKLPMMKRKDAIAKQAYDISDSIIIALASRII